MYLTCIMCLTAIVVGIAAFTSERTNLSPFTKGCRERDAPMRLFSIFGIEPRAQTHHLVYEVPVFMYLTPVKVVHSGVQIKLTWLVLGGDHAARSHTVEQLTAL